MNFIELEVPVSMTTRTKKVLVDMYKVVAIEPATSTIELVSGKIVYLTSESVTKLMDRIANNNHIEGYKCRAIMCCKKKEK